MRSMWTGAICIGIVRIPVKLHAATGQREIALRQVHKDDGGRITLRRVCSPAGRGYLTRKSPAGTSCPPAPWWC